MKVVDARTMRSMDRRAMEEYGISSLVLMENAGRGVAEIAMREFSGHGVRYAVVAGKGNNGGDGFVAARHLANSGLRVKVFLLGDPSDVGGGAGTNLEIWRKMGGEVDVLRTESDVDRARIALSHSGVIIDAVFGTGLSSAVMGYHKRMVDLVNFVKVPVLSVDVPSGLDATTGRAPGSCVEAKITATMAIPKIGLLVYPGASYAGRVKVVDIGMPRTLVEDEKIPWNGVDSQTIRGMIRPRCPDSHKGSFGHLLVLGGSDGKTGAVYMAAMGGLRSGVGLVTIGVPESLNPILEVKTTEAMTYPLPEAEDHTLDDSSLEKIISLAGGKSAIVIGPGLSTSEGITHLLSDLIRSAGSPMVIDADGLNAVAGTGDLLGGAAVPLVLTPHPGEMARLAGIGTEEVQMNRIEIARGFARENNVIVVLKGARTVTASPAGEVFINLSGNPGMATAGTGDVLSGLIGGLIAQGYDPLKAAVAGVYIHGLAGDRVAEEGGMAGMVATDILGMVPNVIASLSTPVRGV